MKLNRIIGSFFGQNDIEIYDANSKQDGNAIAIHLLNPDDRELEDAIEQAYRDNFDKIVCHNHKTWPYNLNTDLRRHKKTLESTLPIKDQLKKFRGLK